MLVLLGVAAITGVGSDSGGGKDDGPLPPYEASAPPHADEHQAACSKLLTTLPVRLGRLEPRVVHTRPDTPYVLAWGDPAVVLSCGVNRPASLRPGSSVEYFTNGPQSGPYYDVTKGKAGNVWTTVDRGPYVSITVPSQYQGADVVPPLSEAIAKALPAVCDASGTAPDPAKLCTRRA